MRDYSLMSSPPWMNSSKVKTVVVEDGVTYIGFYAFAYLDNLSSIVLGKDVKTIGGRAFGYCNRLSSVVIPDNVTTIESLAFNTCQNLKKVVFGKGITSIPYAGFYGCKNLSELTIPINIKKIEGEAFYNTNIKNIYYGGSKSDWAKIEGDKSGFSHATIHYNSSGPSGAKGTNGGQYGYSNTLIMDSAEAKQFLGFLYNKNTEDITEDDWASDQWLPLLTGQLSGDSEAERTKKLAFLAFVDAQIGNNAEHAGANKSYFTDIYLNYLYNYFGYLDDNVEADTFTEYNELVSKLSQNIQESLVDAGCWVASKQGVYITEEMLDNIQEAIKLPGTITSSITNAADLADKVLNGFVAAMATTCGIFESEFFERYSYFSLYLGSRPQYSAPDDEVFQAMLEMQLDLFKLSGGIQESLSPILFHIIGKDNWYDHVGLFNRWGEYVYQMGQSVTIRPTAISLDVTNKAIEFGDMFQLNAELQPTNVTNPTIKWSSSNQDIAIVDKCGIVSVLKPGNVVITAANYDGTVAAQCTVTVTKHIPSYEIPVGLTAVPGQTLADIVLPNGFRWQDQASEQVGSVGEHIFRGMYIPSDTSLYEVIRDIPIRVTVIEPQPVPQVEIDFEKETLSTETTMEYKVDADWITCTKNMSAKAFGWDGTRTVSVQFRTKTIEDKTASEMQSVTIPKRPTAPGTDNFTIIQPGAIGDTGSIDGISPEMEYSIDGGANWAPGDRDTVLGIPGNTTCAVRYKATNSRFKSENYTFGIIAFAASQELSPNVKIDYFNELLTGFEPNNKYIIDGITVAPYNGTVAAAGYIGKIITVVKKGNGTTTIDSAPLSLPIPARPVAPAVQNINETIDGKCDGRIIGLEDGEGYQISGDNGVTWTDVATVGGVITALAPNTYLVRSKATENFFTGEPAVVTIATGEERTYTLNLTVPTFDAVAEGYFQPQPKPITIQSSGNSDATISGVTVSETGKFTIGGSGDTVPAGDSIATWTIQPNTGLATGIHTATVIVTYNDNSTAEAEVSLTVNALVHDWSWEITTPPTMDNSGQAIHACPGDTHHAAHSESGVEIPPLSNTNVWAAGHRTEPTEDMEGSQEYRSNYGTVTITIPATGHTHSYGNEWKSDSANHWHECSCGVKADVTAHTYDDGLDIDCNICGYDRTITTQPDSAQGEGYSIDYDDETITINEGYEVSAKSDGNGNSLNTGAKLTPGITLYIRKSGDSGHTDSSWVAVTIPARPKAPIGVAPVGETAPGANDGKLTGVSTEMEYSADGGATWTVCPGTELTPLAPGSYQVRVRVQPAAFASESVTVTVPDKTAPTHYMVVFDSRGGSNVDNQTVAVGGKVVKPADPTRMGFTFGGWYTEPSCVHRWNFENTLIGDLILNAKWVEKTYSISGTVTEGDSPVVGTTMTLTQGNTAIATATTDSAGKYSFDHVVPGNYNVVTTKEGKTMTILVTIEAANATEKNLAMPSDNVNSVLKVEGKDTPDVVVGGLDEEAEAKKRSGSTVTVTMTVEGKDESSAANAGDIKTTAGVDKTLDFLEIKVEKKVGERKAEPITTTSKLLEIIIPFDFTGKENVTVYRYHGGAAAMTKNPTSGEEGYVCGADHIKIFTKNFSTYAIGYKETTPTYAVTVQTDGHGTASASPVSAVQGTEITLTASPNSGYQFKEWLVVSRGITINDNKFTMPAGNVAVKAIFESTGGDPTGESPSGGNSSGSGSSGGSTSYTLTATADQGGSISPDGKVRVNRNRSQSFTITPNEDYKIADVLVDGKSLGAVTSYEFKKVTKAHTITASFKKVDDTAAVVPPTDWNLFVDIKPNDWFYDSIKYMYENGLMVGTSADQFSPTMSTTRGMTVTILWRLAGEPKAQSTTGFQDVQFGAYYTEAVAWANSAGIINGYGDSTFRPDDSITREQLATILYRYATLEDLDTTQESELTGYIDVDQISRYAMQAMRWANAVGLMKGTDWNGLAPQTPTTRAEVAAILQRYIQTAGK